MRLTLIAVLALPLTLSAQEPAKPAEAPKAAPAASAEKKTSGSEVKVGTAVEKKELVGAAEKFTIAPDTKLWAWAKAVGQPADAKLTLAFFKGDTEAFRKELTAAGSPWRLNAYKTFRAGDAGSWTAKLLGPDGAALAEAKFDVEIEKK